MEFVLCVAASICLAKAGSSGKYGNIRFLMYFLSVTTMLLGAVELMF